MSKGDANSEEETPSFENAMLDLEAIVRKLETGTQPLEQMLSEYARAVELVQHCHKHLNTARRRIAELESVRSDGTAVVHDWDDNAPIIRESTTPPTRRRKS